MIGRPTLGEDKDYPKGSLKNLKPKPKRLPGGLLKSNSLSQLTQSKLKTVPQKPVLKEEETGGTATSNNKNVTFSPSTKGRSVNRKTSMTPPLPECTIIPVYPHFLRTLLSKMSSTQTWFPVYTL